MKKTATKKASKKTATKKGVTRAAWRKVGCTTCKAKVGAPCVSVRGGQVGTPRKPHDTRIARVK